VALISSRSLAGVGPVTAVTYVATLDEVSRFGDAKQVRAYLGLVSKEDSSGEKRHRGKITKAGNSRARWVLVEAAWVLLRTKKPETEALRRWALGIAQRRGKRIAAVALARRLSGILYALDSIRPGGGDGHWRDSRSAASRLNSRSLVSCVRLQAGPLCNDG